MLSRTRAKAELSEAQVRRTLADHGIELIGGGLDEAPQAYKDMHTVMASQQELVEVLGTFTPKIVRMAPEKSSTLLNPICQATS